MKDLDSTVEEEYLKRRTKIADAVANFSYSIVLGGMTDYLSGVKTFWDIFGSRVINTGTATATSTIYGRIREYVYRVTNTDDNSTRKRKYFVDLLAMELFPSPIYGPCLYLGTLATNFITHGVINHETLNNAYDTMMQGYKWVFPLSIIHAAILPVWIDKVRKWMGVETPAEKSGDYHHKHDNLNRS